MKTKRNLSGIYFRHKNDETGKWENWCFEDLPEDKQHILISLKDTEWLKSMVMQLSATLNEIGDYTDIVKQ